MKFMIKKIKDFFHYSKYTSNKDAAEIIRRFVLGSCNDPYEWDDFESIEEGNQEVKLAIHLCWHFANKYPYDDKAEYCNKQADINFFKIADALENNSFKNINIEEALVSLQNDIIPENINELCN